LTPSPIHHQPNNTWALVNKDLIIYTDPTPQTLTTTLLGVNLTIEATPINYTWNFADNTPPLTTHNPGAPYPHHTLTHTYQHTAENITITLTTTWQGQFHITGTTTTYPIAALATTTTTSNPINIIDMTTHLVPNPAPT
ncbi:MAG: hypothetical protein ACK5KU_06945, partial [Beutenbergiaceae bacterium]